MASRFQTAVITEASSSLGRACATHLANAGYDLILVDADRPRLNAFANALTTRTRQSVEVVAMDVDSPVQRRVFVEKLAFDESVAVMVRIEEGTGDQQEIPVSAVRGTPSGPGGSGCAQLMQDMLDRLAARGRAPGVFRAFVILF